VSRRGVHDVAVVGAGMVGAALALRLADSGFDVALIEAREPPPWRAEDDIDLRVVAMAPSSVEFLDRVGAWRIIAASRANAYTRMHVWDATAPGTLTFDAKEQGESALGYIIENRLIQSVLWNSLKQANVAMRVPANVVSTDVDIDRRILALDDGTSLSARLVVAVDGAESALRKMAGIEVRERGYGQRAIVAHVTTARPHESTAWQRFLPNATLAFLPLGDRRSSIVWSAPAEDVERLLALDDSAFCRELGAAFDFRLGTVTATTRRVAIPLRLLLAQRYVAPRLALAGDAAHVVHPLAGQGVNLGLRDAAELANALVDAREAKRDFADDAVLRRFERRRRSDDSLSAYAFDTIQRAFGSSIAPIAIARGTALSIVDRIPPLKKLLARHAAGR